MEQKRKNKIDLTKRKVDKRWKEKDARTGSQMDEGSATEQSSVLDVT